MSETKLVKPRRPPLRWRTVRYKVFMRRNVRYELWRGDQWLVTMRRVSEGSAAWYWYGLNGQNTAHNPKPLEQCKAEAKAAALKWEAEERLQAGVTR